MHRFRCRQCARTVDLDARPPACPECGARLEVAMERDREAVASLFDGGAPVGDMWRVEALLPTAGIERHGLGAGGTPLVSAPTLSRAGVTIRLKNETANPTWSWKDRLNALQLSHVAATGADRVVTSSSGNQGASLAAYASRLGLDALVFLHPDAEAPAASQARAYGATVAHVTDYDARVDLLRTLLDRGWTTTYDLDGIYTAQPYVYPAYATIAYEVVADAGVPDAVVVPVGSGDGLYGVWTGFRDLAERGLIDDVPRIIAAEPAERAPLTRALESGADEVGVDDGPMPASTSVAGTTAGEHALAAVSESGGRSYAIADAEMAAALRETATDGVFLEPASALAPAAAVRAIDEGTVQSGEEVVVVATGAGVTWPAKTAQVVGDVPTIEPTLDALRELGVDVTQGRSGRNA